MTVTINGTTGITTTGDYDAEDGDKILLGTSDDLQIYHDGSNSYLEAISTGAGDLIIQGTGKKIKLRPKSGEDGVVVIDDGAVELYHDNSKKFETTSAGIKVTGTSATFSAPDGGNRYFFGEMGDSASAELSLYDSSDSQKCKISADSSQNTFFNADNNVFINCTSISGSSGRVYTNRGGADSTILEVNQNAGGTAEMITFRKDGSQLGTIHQSGSGVAYQSASDYRLKQDDVVISDGITRVKQLRPIRFKWKSDTDKTVDGFFAHEVSPVVPESVRGNKDEVFDTDGVGTQEKGNPKYQQLDQSKLVPLLTAALQEAITKIETLETKVAALEAA